MAFLAGTDQKPDIRTLMSLIQMLDRDEDRDRQRQDQELYRQQLLADKQATMRLAQERFGLDRQAKAKMINDVMHQNLLDIRSGLDKQDENSVRRAIQELKLNLEGSGMSRADRNAKQVERLGALHSFQKLYTDDTHAALRPWDAAYLSGLAKDNTVLAKVLESNPWGIEFFNSLRHNPNNVQYVFDDWEQKQLPMMAQQSDQGIMTKLDELHNMPMVKYH